MSKKNSRTGTTVWLLHGEEGRQRWKRVWGYNSDEKMFKETETQCLYPEEHTRVDSLLGSWSCIEALRPASLRTGGPAATPIRRKRVWVGLLLCFRGSLAASCLSALLRLSTVFRSRRPRFRWLSMSLDSTRALRPRFPSSEPAVRPRAAHPPASSSVRVQ